MGTANVRLKKVSAEEFLVKPFGRFAHGREFFVWRDHHDTGGLSLWGTLDHATLSFVGSLAASHAKFSSGGDRFILDASELSAVTTSWLPLIAKTIEACRPPLPQVHFVARRGTSATNLLGVLAFLWRDGSFLAHESLSAAMQQLGLSNEQCNYIRDQLRIAQPKDEYSAILRKIEAAPYDATLPEIAARLSISSRTAQRLLAERGQTFRRLRQEILAEEYRDRVANSGDKLHAIAAEFGHATLQSFSADFKRLVGVYPSDYRLARQSTTQQHSATARS